MSSGGQKKQNNACFPASLSSLVTYSSEETKEAGRIFASAVSQKAALFCLYGDLGSGKTTFIKGMISQWTDLPQTAISSPTFTYVHPYTTTHGHQLYHFDLYRIECEEQFLAKGFEEYLHQKALCCIEWPEKIASLLPPSRYEIHFSYITPKARTIHIAREACMKKNLSFTKLHFLTSALEPEQWPALRLPEMALIGRSNVGKIFSYQTIF